MMNATTLRDESANAFATARALLKSARARRFNASNIINAYMKADVMRRAHQDIRSALVLRATAKMLRAQARALWSAGAG